MVTGFMPTKRTGALLMVLLIALLLVGCTPEYIRFPQETTSLWVCSDPYITLQYTWDENGNYHAEEMIYWNGESIDISFSNSPGNYFVSRKDDTHYDQRLFRGTWECEDDTLILTITEDFLFDGAYKELVFERVE